jgi:hypothetical protein
MSESNTAKTRQIAKVELVKNLFVSLRNAVSELNCDILDEDAIDNLRTLLAQSEGHIEELDRSTHKLLD